MELVNILKGLHDVIACFGDWGGSLWFCFLLPFSQCSSFLDTGPWKQRLRESSWDKISARTSITWVVPAVPLHVWKDGDHPVASQWTASGSHAAPAAGLPGAG